MDVEIKEAFLKMIETGTEIAPDVMSDLLLWAKIEPFMFIPVLILFSVVFILCIPKTEKTDKINMYDIACMILAPILIVFSIGFIVSVSSAIKAHFAPYAYMIDLIK